MKRVCCSLVETPSKPNAVALTGGVAVDTVVGDVWSLGGLTELIGVPESTRCLVSENAQVVRAGLPPQSPFVVTPGIQIAKYQAVAKNGPPAEGTLKTALAAVKGVAFTSQNTNSKTVGSGAVVAWRYSPRRCPDPPAEGLRRGITDRSQLSDRTAPGPLGYPFAA